jgi:hypothetical protein
MKSILALALLIAIGGVTIWFQVQTRNQLRSENASLKQQITRLQADNDDLASRLAAAVAAQKNVDDQMNELLRLRGEVARLRQAAKQAAKPQPAPPATSTDTIPTPDQLADPAARESQVIVAKVNDAKETVLEYLADANAHQGQFSADIDDANLYTRPGYTGTNHFELAYRGTRNAITDPPNTILIRERSAWRTADGKWAKVYGYADGHAELRTTPDGNFTQWEPPQSAPVDQ